MVAALKLEGSDRRATPGVELSGSICLNTGKFTRSRHALRIDRLIVFSSFYGWCCMAVLSW